MRRSSIESIVSSTRTEGSKLSDREVERLLSNLQFKSEQSKEAYDLALRQTQGTIRTESANWQPWLNFFLRALAAQAAFPGTRCARASTPTRQRTRGLV